MSGNSSPSAAGAASFRIALPEPSTTYDQDNEWCLVYLDGQWREYRFHDYDKLYEVPGLYERIFYDVLQCDSPRVVVDLLRGEIARTQGDIGGLRALDLGAGNGIVADELVTVGVNYVVGVDILPEARRAALRDRGSAYRDYLVTDMAELPVPDRQTLVDHQLNTLVCVAALGFGDIPPRCFENALNLVADGGRVAFNIKDQFLSDQDTSGFSGFVKQLVDGGALEIRASRRYQHRLATDRTPIYYTAMVGVKTGEFAG